MVNDLMTLNISEEMIKGIVSKQVQQAIVRELGNSEDYMCALVASALHQKVSKEGSVSSYSSDNKFDYLDVLLSKEIQKAANEAIKEYIKENSELLKTSLKKELSKTATKDELVKTFIDGASKCFNSSWNFRCDVAFKPSED